MTGLKKTKIGNVISNKMSKTVVVLVSRQVKHTIYQKYYTKRGKFKAHDEKNECGVGDRVLIQECRPISREKKWVVVKILEKGAA